MGIDVEQERRFYDAHYAQYLDLPDHALRLDRGTLLAGLDDPANPMFERRRLYGTVIERLLREPLAGLSVLDYGCGPGDFGLLMAAEGARVTFLDLSSTAIALCLARARAGGLRGRVRGFARDASDLRCFGTHEFDLIFASAALHHTLKYPNAVEELLRVLRPGGRLYLAETLGNNALLNFARRLRATIAREPEEQGEEIILGERELGLLAESFDLEVIPMNLLAMAKRLFRGRFGSTGVRWVLRTLEKTDRALLAMAPVLGRYCGEALIVATRRTVTVSAASAR
ncbi:MAG: class I SAM-dependent methyltransferase [Bryobacteraceae bacterium]